MLWLQRPNLGGNYKGITKATLPPDIWIITGGLPSSKLELDNKHQAFDCPSCGKSTQMSLFLPLGELFLEQNSTISRVGVPGFKSQILIADMQGRILSNIRIVTFDIHIELTQLGSMLLFTPLRSTIYQLHGFLQDTQPLHASSSARWR